jgi:hypothetical protein
MILPDHVKEKIHDPVERKRHGRTMAESIIKAGLELEREEHAKFQSHLDREDYAYIHSRTDRRTTQNLGVPDFYIGGRIGLAIEFKRKDGKLSPQQEEWRRRHEARNGIYVIVETYQQALEILKTVALAGECELLKRAVIPPKARQRQ